ncbi:hypothetical protein FIBSPDRAFT_941843 [Athelia psychrophila]|uniref:HIT domain-containing protein n=1 Tax=Athelia psychrophila TaxID=1759441 RepID=A0A167TCK3_9AGAM|nr:hypothetical protein FIBSPDRAFT_941843 [Fibularhizoctonia sp. CBS 109695]
MSQSVLSDGIAILDINPLSEGHTLVMPKYHANKLDEVPDQYLVDLLPLSKKIAVSTGCPNYNLLQNNGQPPPSVSFRHVPHFHIHVIPKRDGQDGIRFRAEDFDRRVAERDEKELTKIGAGPGQDERRPLANVRMPAPED